MSRKSVESNSFSNSPVSNAKFEQLETRQMLSGQSGGEGTPINVPFASVELDAPVVKVKAKAPDQIRLSWTPVAGANFYRIERANGKLGEWKEFRDTTETMLTKSGLEGDRFYRFRVIAVAGNGDETTSDVASIKPNDDLERAARRAAKIARLVENFRNQQIEEVAGHLDDVNDPKFRRKINKAQTGFATRMAAMGVTYTPMTVEELMPVSATTPPRLHSSPPVFSVAVRSSSELAVNWTAATGGIAYKIERSANSGSTWSIVAFSTGTRFIDVGLVADTSYQYRMSTISSSDTSAASSVQTGVTSPIAPTTVETATVDATTVDITWTTVANATSYTIERSTNNSTWTALVPSVALTGSDDTFSDETASAGTTYYYRVTTVNGVRSSSASISVPATTVTLAPTLTATAVSGTRVNLTWNAQSTAFDYLVERSDDAGTTWAEIGTTSAARYADAVLDPDTDYSYRVSAINAGGTSEPSAEVAVTTLLATVVGVTATAAADADTITVEWTAAANADTYTIERSLNQTSWTALDTSSLTGSDDTFDDTTVLSGRTYYYRVSASNTAGTGAPSLSASALVRPATPAGLTGTLTAPGTISLTWSAATTATSYTIERSADGGTTWDVVGTPSARTLVDSGQPDNTEILYRVSATNGSGTSDASSEFSITTQPATPDNIGVTYNDSTNENEITWEVSTDATSYVIQRSANSGAWTTLTPGVALVGSDTSYNDGSSIQPGTSYRYRISATNANGTSTVSAPVTILTEPAIPTLQGSAGSATVINLSWNTVTTATGYTLQASDDAGSTWNTIYTGSTASYSNTGLTANTEYQYQVLATNATGDSEYCTPITVTTILDVPTGLAATTPDGNTVVLEWDASTDATGYRLERSANAGSTWTVLTPNPVLSGSDVTYTDTGRTPNTAYQYRISAVNAAGTSAAATAVSITTRVGAPTGLAAASTSATSLTVSWTAVSGATSYKIETSTDNGTSWSDLVTQAGVSYVNTGLTADTAYQYRVTAIGSAGAGLASAAVTGRTLLAAPSGFSLASPTSTSVTVSWTASTGASGYRIERSANAGSTWAALTPSPALTGTSNTYTDTGLTAGTSYQYRMAGISTAGTSANTSAATIVTRTNAPVVAGTVASSSQVNLTWPAVTAATSYLVQRSSDAGANWTNAGTPSTNSQSVTGLTAYTDYLFRVFAVNASGNSVASNSLPLKTQLAAPSALATTLVSTTEIRLSWNTVSGATGYKLERAVGTGAYAVVTPTTPFTGSSSTFANTGLTAGTTYKFRISATVGTATSAASSELTVVTLPVAPVLTTTTPSTTQINLTWPAVTSASTYRVEMSGDLGSTWSILGTPSSATYNATGLNADTAYSFRVSALNASGASAASNVVNTRTRLVTPTGLTVLDASSTSVTLAWDRSDNATTYIIERSANSGSTWTTVVPSPALAGEDTSYEDTGLTGGTTYQYRISGSNAAGASTATSTVSATTLPGAPVVTATAVSSAPQINLTWTTSATATSYRVERTADSGATWVTIASPTGTSFSDTGVAPAREYQYRVSAVNSSGAGAASAPVTVSTSLNAPASVTATTASATVINLAWSASAGATGYKVERSTDTTTWTNLTTTLLSSTTTFYASTALTAGTQYYYRVTAAGPGTIVSAPSATVRATTVLAAPVGVTATSPNTTTINLSWTLSTNFNLLNYKLQRSANGTNGWTTIASPLASANTYSNTGLTTATRYFYRLIAVSIAGDSAPSAVVNATTR